MSKASKPLDRYTVHVTDQELLLINNALNEVCNGVHIDDAEFATRLGGSREEARTLLRRVHQLLNAGSA